MSRTGNYITTRSPAHIFLLRHLPCFIFATHSSEKSGFTSVGQEQNRKRGEKLRGGERSAASVPAWPMGACTHVCAYQCDINIAIIIYVLSRDPTFESCNGWPSSARIPLLFLSLSFSLPPCSIFSFSLVTLRIASYGTGCSYLALSSKTIVTF